MNPRNSDQPRPPDDDEQRREPMPAVQPPVRIPAREPDMESERERGTSNASDLRIGLTFNAARLTRWATYSMVIVVLAAATGFIVSSLRTEVYGARTEILFPLQDDLSSGFLREDRRLITQLESIRSRATLAPVAAEQGLSISELEERVGASVLGGSEIIRIEARSEDPAQALVIVTAVSEQYLSGLEDDRTAAVLLLFEAERGALTQERADAQARIDEIQFAAAALPAGETLPAALQAELNGLFTQLANLEAELSDLDRRQMDLEVAQALAPRPLVLAAPYEVSGPVAPNTLFDTALAGAIGVTIAAGLLAVLIARTVGAARAD